MFRNRSFFENVSSPLKMRFEFLLREFRNNFDGREQRNGVKDDWARPEARNARAATK